MADMRRTANLSTRVSLRWPPEPAFENTDTLSLSVGGWYVDLRVDKQSGELEWAMAGQRIVQSENPSTVVFTHEIDSLGHFETVDCGVFTKLPNGDDLETGQMPRTDLPGAPIRDYEEIWRDIDLPTSGASWILESEADPAGQQFEGDTSKDGEANGVVKTFVGVVLGHFIALRQRQWLEVEEQNGRKVARKRGGAVSARREESISTGDNSFMTIFSIGDESETLSLRADIENGLELSEKVGPGEVLTVNDCKYIVRAFEK